MPSTAEMSTPIITTNMPRPRRGGGDGTEASAVLVEIFSLTIDNPASRFVTAYVTT